MEGFKRKLKQQCCFFPKLIFKCVGISFDGNETKCYRTYSFFMLAVIATYSGSAIHSLVRNFDNFDIVINDLFNLLSGSTGYFITLVMVYKRKSISQITKQIEQIQERHNTEEWSQNIVYSVNQKILAITILAYSSLLFVFTNSITQKYLEDDSRKWRTPAMDITFIDISYSPNFEIAWAYQVVGVTMVGTCFCYSIFFIASMMVDMTVQFKLLSFKIKQIFNPLVACKYEDNGITHNSRTFKLQQNIKQLVVEHQNLIRLVNDIEDVSSYIMLLNATGNTGMICCSIYYATVLPLLDLSAMQSYLEVFMVTLTLFYVCYWGTQISLASQTISSACYEINFVGTNVRFQKDLLIIMMRSQKPVTLTVGKFTMVSITVFAWTMRTSYSYLMVLRNST